MCETYNKGIQNFSQNLKGKGSLNRPKHIQEDNMDFKQIRHVDVWTKFMWLSTGSVVSCYAPGNESYEFHKGWGFFDSPSDR